MRTPLTSLTAIIELIAQHLHAAPADHGDAVDPRAARDVQLMARAETQLHRLARLVSDMVDDARIQAGSIELSLERVNLLDVVRAAVEEQRLTYAERQITLEEPTETGPMMVMADAERLAQVITNFVANAVTYSDSDQGIVVSAYALAESAGHASQPDQAPQAHVSVRDHGIGMAAGERARIWERFQRIESLRHRSGSHVGLGLGLYIGKAIIELHGGQIGVESAPGAGSEFWFRLPIYSASR